MKFKCKNVRVESKNETNQLNRNFQLHKSLSKQKQEQRYSTTTIALHAHRFLRWGCQWHWWRFGLTLWHRTFALSGDERATQPLGAQSLFARARKRRRRSGWAGIANNCIAICLLGFKVREKIKIDANKIH